MLKKKSSGGGQTAVCNTDKMKTQNIDKLISVPAIGTISIVNTSRRHIYRGGMRIGEVLKLTPSDIYERRLALKDPKSGREQEFIFITV